MSRGRWLETVFVIWCCGSLFERGIGIYISERGRLERRRDDGPWRQERLSSLPPSEDGFGKVAFRVVFALANDLCPFMGPK